MEAFERFSSEFKPIDLKHTVFNTHNEVPNALNPHNLILPANSAYTEDVKLRWTEGWDLLSEETVSIPSSAVYYPYYSEVETQLLKPNTNGLASGNTYEEAIFHGLMEVIERDAWSLVEFKKKVMPDIDASDLDDGPIGILLKAYSDSNLELIIKDITSDTGIPTVAAISEDAALRDPTSMTIGFGSHLNPEIAIIRATLEVAQSRMVQLHGLRRDVGLKVEIAKRLGYKRFRRLNKHWFMKTRKCIKIKSMRHLDTGDILEDVHVTLKKLKSKGFEKILVANLTRRNLGIPVVRVVVPGLESSIIDPERAGKRLRSIYSPKYH